MKKIIEKSYILLLYIFFALYMLLLHVDSEEKINIFAIGLIIGSMVIGVIPFFTNKCKKQNVRRWYLVSMILTGAYITFYAILILCAKSFVALNDKVQNAFDIVLLVLRGCFIGCDVFLVFEEVKDLFKKDYSIQHFDMQAFIMILNALAYGAIVLICFYEHPTPGFVTVINTVTYQVDDVIVKIASKNVYGYGVLYTSIAYVIIYVAVQIISYFRFDKTNNNQ